MSGAPQADSVDAESSACMLVAGKGNHVSRLLDRVNVGALRSLCNLWGHVRVGSVLDGAASSVV